MSRSFSLFHHPTQQLEDVKFFLVVLMTLIASIITFSKKKKIGQKNVTLDPRHGTLALDKKTDSISFVLRSDEVKYHCLKNDVPENKLD